MTQNIQQIESTTAVIAEAPVKQTQEQVSQMSVIREQNKKLQQVVADLNEMMGMSGTTLSFAVDRASNKTIIRVVDEKTKEVIRQIPSEDAVKVAQHIHGLMGILYDASA
jgi:flagellar protein FlaG